MFNVGDRVHYRVAPSMTPDTRTAGTVTSIEDGLYYVAWDDVDPRIYKPTAGYGDTDLAAANPATQ
jgi:hypothetical protein